MLEGRLLNACRIVRRLGADEETAWYEGVIAGGLGLTRQVVVVALQPHVAGNERVRAAFVGGMTRVRGPVDSRVVAPEDAGPTAEPPYYVTTACRGWPLAALFDGAAAVPVTVSACVWIVHQLARAIAALQSPAGRFVHGAIHPGMVYLAEDGAVRVSTAPFRSSCLGRGPKDDFRAPELRVGSEPTLRSDVYSAARVLCHALDRLPQPVSGRTAHDLVESNGALRAAIAPALSREPGERPADLASLADRLEAALPVHVGAGHVARLVAKLPRDHMTFVGVRTGAGEPTTLLDDDQKGTGEGPRRRSRAPSKSTRLPRVRMVGGGGQELVLAEGRDRWVVGRSKEADLVLDDRDASREHFELLRMDDGVFRVFDLGSKNGLRVNGRETDEHTLRPGDELCAGTSVLRYEP